MEKVFEARKKNRVLRIPESRVKEYSELGYTIKDGDGNVVFEPENKAKKIADLEAENADLKAKLEEAEKYAEDADKKIADLEAEIAGLKEDKKPAAKKPSKAKASDNEEKGQEAE